MPTLVAVISLDAPGDLRMTLQDGLSDDHGSEGLSLFLKLILSLGFCKTRAKILGQ